jgi:PAS domain S-box-containing protein
LDPPRIVILLVEDEPSHADLVAHAFQRSDDDARIRVAGTLAQARKALADEAPDLLIADVILPDGRGTELLEKSAAGRFPVIIMTSHGSEELAVDALKSGADDYVVKSPETLAQMPRTARRVLTEWDLRRQHHEAQEQLAASQQRYALAAQAGRIGVWEYGIDTGIFAADRSLCELLGYEVGEVSSRIEDWIAIIHADDRDRVSAAVEGHLAGDTTRCECEYRVRRKGGGYTWLRTSGSVVDTGERSERRMLGASIDITAQKELDEALRRAHDELEMRVQQRTQELVQANASLVSEIADRKRVEAALRESEERFRAEYNALPIPTYTWRRSDDENDFVLADFNNATLRLTQGRIPEFIGRRASELYRETPEVMRALSECFVQKRVIREECRSCLPSIGADCFLVVTYVYVPPDAVMVHVEDVTKRKQVEADLRKERELLGELLDLQERDRKLVAYEIHDGLAQLLSGSLMSLQAYMSQLSASAQQSSNELRHATTTLEKALAEARRLIDGLRPPLLDQAGVVEAIRHLIEEQRPLCRAEIELHTEVRFKRLPPPLENTIFRVAQEALNNACRYSRSDRISVSLKQQGRRVMLEIRDWGVGFEVRDVEEQHFGLQGMRERARLFGGTATIESAPDRGTTVRVELPLVEENARQPRG